MNRSRKRTEVRGNLRRVLSVWISLLVVFLSSIHFGPVGVLSLESPSQIRVLWFNPLVPGDRLELLYEHSMYHVIQKEIYQTGATGELILRKMVFGSLGAAAYYDPEQAAQRIGNGDSWEVSGLAYPVPEFSVFVNHSHRLFVGDQAINLAAQFGDGSRVWIKKYSYFGIVGALALNQAKDLVRNLYALATIRGGSLDS